MLKHACIINSLIWNYNFFERGKSKISGHIIKNLVDNHLDSIIDILTNPFGFYVIRKSLKIQDENWTSCGARK